MAIEDALVTALKALCSDGDGTYGKTAFVAKKANLSAANLSQIINGVKLPSGRPRGVGPSVRNALDEHFPGWRDWTGGAPARGSVTVLSAASSSRSTIEGVLLAAAALPEKVRRSTANMIRDYLHDPDDNADLLRVVVDRLSGELEAGSAPRKPRSRAA